MLAVQRTYSIVNTLNLNVNLCLVFALERKSFAVNKLSYYITYELYTHITSIYLPSLVLNKRI